MKDYYYVIDAYNLLFKTRRPSKFSEKNKNEFVRFLDQWMGALGLKGILIFDSNPNHASDYPTRSSLSHLEIAHAPIYVEGDLYILEYLSVMKNPSRVRLITSDRALAAAAKNLKVSAIDSLEFFKLLEGLSLKKDAIRSELKPLFESKRELERLQKIFEANSYEAHDS